MPRLAATVLAVTGLAVTTLAAPGQAEADRGSAAVRPTAAPAERDDSATHASDRYVTWSGRQIVDESVRRHEQFPYVYEEQTMVLMDAGGHRTVRQLRRFSRLEADGRFRLLLVFDHPEEIRGVSLLAVRNHDGTVEQGLYLPAIDGAFKRPGENGQGGTFLGTDFAVDDLGAERTWEHRYVRGHDTVLEDVNYFVVDAFPRDAGVVRAHGYGLRRHLIRKDNFVIVRTDFFDRRLRLLKRLTRHDLRQVDGPSWRANMLMMVDARDQHRTLLKVDRRVYSRDYVPAEIFEPDQLISRGANAIDPGRTKR